MRIITERSCLVSCCGNHFSATLVPSTTIPVFHRDFCNLHLPTFRRNFHLPQDASGPPALCFARCTNGQMVFSLNVCSSPRGYICEMRIRVYNNIQWPIYLTVHGPHVFLWSWSLPVIRYLVATTVQSTKQLPLTAVCPHRLGFPSGPWNQRSFQKMDVLKAPVQVYMVSRGQSEDFCHGAFWPALCY